ncbi:hypothetical protein HK099_006130 [Clydaea vesicula]|uniref:Uncharacterized protein n=1 Tax=Clydaea vesicula TaxID=447962 RepID=A0AAD5U637_9FUNG|nr:hypothetical protein HK099_006130 [Clydaea vesicula]KAJ3396315.1 hypothetical protein HDU92_003374 [Lobulomyces angularis]
MDDHSSSVSDIVPDTPFHLSELNRDIADTDSSFEKNSIQKHSEIYSEQFSPQSSKSSDLQKYNSDFVDEEIDIALLIKKFKEIDSKVNDDAFKNWKRNKFNSSSNSISKEAEKKNCVEKTRATNSAVVKEKPKRNFNEIVSNLKLHQEELKFFAVDELESKVKNLIKNEENFKLWKDKKNKEEQRARELKLLELENLKKEQHLQELKRLEKSYREQEAIKKWKMEKLKIEKSKELKEQEEKKKKLELLRIREEKGKEVFKRWLKEKKSKSKIPEEKFYYKHEKEFQVDIENIE